jgi:hypothetical protein
MTPTSDGGRTAIRWVFLTIAVVLGVWYAHRQYAEHVIKVEVEKAEVAQKAAEYARTHPPPSIPQIVVPAVVYATTPATITANYEFNIEADGPIMVQYYGEKPVEYVPGKGFTQLPQPQHSGPKTFTAPNNGHVAFRLYPVHQGR